jgi:hypothetical protein
MLKTDGGGDAFYLFTLKQHPNGGLRLKKIKPYLSGDSVLLH